MNITYCKLFIEICQLSSRAMTTLSSAQALRQPPTELVNAVVTLDTKSQELRSSLESFGLLDDPTPSLTEANRGFTKSQRMFLNFLYHALILDIHSALAFPWPYRTSEIEHHPQYRHQVEESSARVAEASRNVILMTRFIDIHANSTVL